MTVGFDPWRELTSVDRELFDGLLDQLTRVLAALRAASAAPSSELQDFVGAGQAFVDESHLARRRLGASPGWDGGNRLFLSEVLSQWMVPGSPAQLVKAGRRSSRR